MRPCFQEPWIGCDFAGALNHPFPAMTVPSCEAAIASEPGAAPFRITWVEPRHKHATGEYVHPCGHVDPTIVSPSPDTPLARVFVLFAAPATRCQTPPG